MEILIQNNNESLEDDLNRKFDELKAEIEGSIKNAASLAPIPQMEEASEEMVVMGGGRKKPSAVAVRSSAPPR